MRISYKPSRILPSYVQQTNVIMTLYKLQSARYLSDDLIPQHSPNKTPRLSTSTLHGTGNYSCPAHSSHLRVAFSSLSFMRTLKARSLHPSTYIISKHSSKLNASELTCWLMGTLFIPCRLGCFEVHKPIGPGSRASRLFPAMT